MLLAFPDELLVYIASFLALVDKISFAAACRRLRGLAWGSWWDREIQVGIHSLAAARSFAAFCHRNAAGWPLLRISIEFKLPDRPVTISDRDPLPFPNGEPWPIRECLESLPAGVGDMVLYSVFEPDMITMSRFTRLESLVIKHECEIKIDLAPLARLPLTHLDLGHVEMSIVTWHVQMHLPKTLRHLRVYASLYEYNGLCDALRELKDLRRFEMYPPEYYVDDRERFTAALENIHVTHLACPGADLFRMPESVRHFESYYGYIWPTASSPHVTDITMSSLSISSSIWQTDLRAFTGLERLRVHQQNNAVHGPDSMVPCPPSLTHLSLTGDEDGDGDSHRRFDRLPRGLDAVSSLRSLDLSGNPKLFAENEGLGDTMDVLSKLTNFGTSLRATRASTRSMRSSSCPPRCRGCPGSRPFDFFFACAADAPGVTRGIRFLC